jgi:Ca2+-transporting ATPase
MPDIAGKSGARGGAAKAVQPDGLSTADAAARLARDGPNLLPGSAPRTLWDMVRGVFTEPMFLMLLVAGGIYLLLGDRAEAALLLAFVLVVIGITLAQERKTQRALESLRDLSAPRALVIRDGQEQRTAGRDVVRGDLLLLHEGDRVAADAVLVQGQLTVDESLLTGEAVPVDKLPAPAPDAAGPPTPATPGGDGTPHLFASTVVTKGVGLARVHATGTATAVGRIGQALAATVEPPSGLQRSSRRLIVQLTIAGLLLATAQILLGWLWDGHSLLASVLSGIALAMAILPEEIPVILTVFLALGAWRISQNKVLTRRMSAVETLGAITVLATDKTGTLTQNVMRVAELRTSGARFSPEGATGLPEPFHALAEFALLATPADPFDPMEKALQQFGRQWLQRTEHVHADWTPAMAYALSPDILAMTHVFSRQGPDEHLLATKGAPEAVMDLCHLPQPERDAIAAEVMAMAQRGLRVLGVARGMWQGTVSGNASVASTAGASTHWPASQHDFTFSFLGLVAFMDPPRDEVPAALAECRAAGVRVIMMTGDHPATASAIAQQVGLSERPAVLTGPEIAALGDDALRIRLRAVDLCARLQPEQKLRLVQLLQQDGEVVAMTGDGVNDAPALKAADVGVAMGQRGTDVAREAAALVLLDDSFASIVAAIRQGRRIYDNITHATRFVFAVHMPVILLTLIPALLHWPALLLPVHIVLLELLIDPACSIVFEAEHEAADLMTRAPRARDASPFAMANLGIGLAQGFGLAAILLLGYGVMTGLVGAPQSWGMDFGKGAGLSEDSARAVVFMALVSGVFLLVLANRSPHRALAGKARQANPWLVRMAAAVVVLLVAVNLVPWLRNVMRFAVPDTTGLAAAAVLLTVTGVWLWMARRFTVWRAGRPANSAS